MLSTIVTLSVLLLSSTVSGYLQCFPYGPPPSSECGEGWCRCTATIAVCSNHGHLLNYIPHLQAGITKVYFGGNLLSNVTRETFINVSVSTKVLSIINNTMHTISEDSFASFVKLTVLCLDHNEDANKTQLADALRALTTEKPLFVSMASIGLDSLPDDYFSTSSKVSKLDLHNNVIKYVNWKAFKSLKTLKELNLYNSTIRVLEDSVGHDYLQYLNLAVNSIGPETPKFCSTLDGLPLFPRLQTLHLNKNAISYLHVESFRCLSKLRNLKLGGNKINILPNNVFSSLHSLKSLKILKMRGGVKTLQPRAFNFSNVRTLKFLGNSFDFAAPDLKVKKVFQYSGSLRKLDISYNKLQKVTYKHNLLSLIGPLKRLENFKAVSTGISRLPKGFFDMFENLSIINLEINNIHQLSNCITTRRNLDKISLVRNKIRVLDRTALSDIFLKSVKVLNLADNPFSCTCDNLWFRSVITDKGKIHNLTLASWPKGYQCATPANLVNKKFKDYRPTESSCHPRNYIIIATVTLAIVLVISTCVVVIVYKYRWHVKYWIYKLKTGKGNQETQPLLSSCYDAFVIYNPSDSQYAHYDFRTLLEEEHAYTLHLWERDVTSGHDNFREMVTAVETSRHALAILSRDSLDDGWFQFQISVALDHQVSLKRPYLMLVLLDNVDCGVLSKFWCVLLTRLPSACWFPDKTHVKYAAFKQQLLSHLGNQAGQSVQ